MGSSSVEAWYTFRAEPLELSTTQDTPLLACHTFLVYALGLGNLILQSHIALLYSIGVSSCTRTSRPCCKRLKLRHSMPTPHILLDETASAPDVSRFHHVYYRRHLALSDFVLDASLHRLPSGSSHRDA
ncbi:hypothetical protein R3P38DRAFT_3275289 [Favolaschia claudopus]|uniref:Uncharacterized protein n=1 Tax=Favolaschia claudopus TaxID=2862362 RepID=A0AAW0AYS2_9AGAR